MKEFYSSPLVKFILHMIFTACLLLLYGYVLLLEMRAFDFSVQELILHVWILSSIVDDIRQIYVKSKERSLKRKLQYHCVSIWNHVEVIGIVLYFVGLSLRLTNTTETFELGRILLCLNFALHAVRVSILYFLHNGLGAKLVILETMAQDLINFLLMFLIVVFSFGIAIQALILREPHIHWSLFSADLFSLPYVYIFQEMNPKSIIGPKNHPNITSSVEVIGAFRTHIALCLSGIYILLSCLLVISLMASLFRRIKTAFNSQQTDGEIHYGPFHFHLVRDYVLKPTLPPPFSVLCYIYNFIHQIISRGVGQQGYALSKHSSPLRLKYLITWQGKIVGEYLSKSKNNNQ